MFLLLTSISSSLDCYALASQKADSIALLNKRHTHAIFELFFLGSEILLRTPYSAGMPHPSMVIAHPIAFTAKVKRPNSDVVLA